MSAGASPTKADPKPLARGQLPTSVGTLYTAPDGERGTRLTAILLTNVTTDPVTATLYEIETGGSVADNRAFVKNAPVPEDGYPIDVPASDRIIIAPNGTLRGRASAASAVTYKVFGIEMDD